VRAVFCLCLQIAFLFLPSMLCNSVAHVDLGAPLTHISMSCHVMRYIYTE
jgi:hypothetical protein